VPIFASGSYKKDKKGIVRRYAPQSDRAHLVGIEHAYFCQGIPCAIYLSGEGSPWDE